MNDRMRILKHFEQQTDFPSEKVSSGTAGITVTGKDGNPAPNDQLVADKKGIAAFRGVIGTYDVQITVGGVTTIQSPVPCVKKSNPFTLTV